jgi:PQQ-like domain
LGAVPADKWTTAVWSFNGDRVFLGTGDGHFYSLDSASGVLTEQAVKLPKLSPSTRMTGGWVTRIAGFDDRSVFATLASATQTSSSPPSSLKPPVVAPVIQSYVLAFDGSGWAPTQAGGLPNTPAFGLLPLAVPHTRVERALLVALDSGVWISRDDGASFAAASKGLPRRAHCADLRFVRGREGGTIYLATYGRSVWQARV